MGNHPIEELSPVVSLETVHRARATSTAVTAAEPVREFITRLAAYTREQANIGVSPQGSIALLRSAQAPVEDSPWLSLGAVRTTAQTQDTNRAGPGTLDPVPEKRQPAVPARDENTREMPAGSSLPAGSPACATRICVRGDGDNQLTNRMSGKLMSGNNRKPEPGAVLDNRYKKQSHRTDGHSGELDC